VCDADENAIAANVGVNNERGLGMGLMRMPSQAPFAAVGLLNTAIT
jgi:hypothetical protein